MNTQHLENWFQAMGARFRARVTPDVRWAPSGYALDIQRDRRGEFFELRVPRTLDSRLEASVLQARPRERHLLLLVRGVDPSRSPDRFLCGHDEREWFVAAVPGGASNVAQAMESLKPSPVLAAQAVAGLSARQRRARKNRAYRRQGEWFFVPAPWVRPDPRNVLRAEPIRRGAGKPHFVEQVFREGGVDVYVCHEFPNGLPEKEYRQLLAEDPARGRWFWRRMRRDAAVYARGTVRHPDHRTITLPDWHRVLMNTESAARGRDHVAFLD